MSDAGEAQVAMTELDVSRFRDVRMRSGFGWVDARGAVDLPGRVPDRRAPAGRQVVQFRLTEVPTPVAVIRTGDGELFQSEWESYAAERLLASGVPVVAWIGPEAEGGAVVHCYSESEHAVDEAACAVWAAEQGRRGGDSASLGLFVTHVVDDTRSAGTTARFGGYLRAVGVPKGPRWSVEIRRAPGGFEELAEALHGGGSGELIAVDIDWTMPFNDAYGYQRADLMLARVLSAGEGVADEWGGSFIRTGGDDFAIVLPAEDGGDARRCAESMRSAVHDLDIEFHHPEVRTHGRVTVSIAVLRAEALPHDVEALRNAVRDAVYEAKRRGRDQVCVAEPGST